MATPLPKALTTAPSAMNAVVVLSTIASDSDSPTATTLVPRVAAPVSRSMSVSDQATTDTLPPRGDGRPGTDERADGAGHDGDRERPAGVEDCGSFGAHRRGEREDVVARAGVHVDVGE